MSEGNILIIDDEKKACEFLKKILENKGYLAQYKTSGKEGIAAACAGNFDVILVDLKMPGLDGIAVLRAVKEHDPGAVIIIITAYPSDDTVEETLRGGAYNYVIKPFDFDEILFVLKRAVSYRKLLHQS